jgi:outer membrane protein TolC
MRLFLASASVVLSMAAGNQQAGSTLTFDEALSLAAARSSVTSSTAPLRLEVADLRRARLPNVRAEIAGNTSRTLDLFSEGPLEVRYATSVLAFDYSLWDGGATSARINSVEAKLRRISSRNAMDDARFHELLNAFGDLYLAQRQSEVLRPLYDHLSANNDTISSQLAAGEISNLTAADRREIALGFESRLLEIESRRIDAVTKIRLFTGLEAEPRLVIDLQSAPSSRDAGRGPGEGPSVADDSVKVTTLAVDDSRARLREVQASSGFRATLSGFAGVGAAQSEFRHIASDGSFGVYGVRVLVSYPLFRGTSAIALAEARADVEESLASRNAARDAARLRAEEYRFQEQTAQKRISLMEQSVETAKQREESLQRLVAGGLRSEGDLAQAQAERVRRETDLLAIEIDRWKAAQLLARMTAAGDTRGSD